MLMMSSMVMSLPIFFSFSNDRISSFVFSPEAPRKMGSRHAANSHYHYGFCRSKGGFSVYHIICKSRLVSVASWKKMDRCASATAV